MYSYVVAVTHVDGDRIGTLKVNAASAANAEEEAVTKLVDGRPIPRSAYRAKAMPVAAAVCALP